MNRLGNSSIGGSSADSPNYIGSKFTATEDGTISEISFYTKATSGSITTSAAIYSDNNGVPGQLLVSAVSSQSIDTNAQWVTIPISLRVAAGQTIWMFTWSSASRTVYWSAGSANQYYTNGATYSSWPNPDPASGSYFARSLSVFVGYTPIISNKTKKRFLHKIYNGSTYVRTLQNDLVLNKPNFSWAINGGMGEMLIDLALTLLDFQTSYENTIIKFGYRLKTFVQGADEITDTQIYDGLITGYEPIVSNEGRQIVRVHVISMATQLENMLLKSGSNTEITYTSQDPAAMLRDIIDKIACNVAYTTPSVETTSTTVTYVFNFTTGLEAVRKVQELCPSYWYWYLAPDSTIHLHPSDFDSPQHKLFIGKHVQSISARKSIDDLKNAVYFKGGGATPLYKLYERTSSISEYGRREERYSDERVTLAATAQIIATKILDEKDHPLSIVTATVVDNSIDTEKGYDIESLRPGDIVQIIDPRYETKISLWSDGVTGGIYDIDFWDYDIRYSLGLPMQIRQITYNYHTAKIELTAKIEDVNKRIEDIKRNLDTVRTENLPAAPS